MKTSFEELFLKSAVELKNILKQNKNLTTEEWNNYANQNRITFSSNYYA